MAQNEKYIPHYTYDDYVHWKGRWELIEGHPIAMSPLPIPQHQECSANIIYEFKHTLKQSSCKVCKVFSPLDYKVSEDTTLQPDVLIVCGKTEKPFLDFPPALVVEILSPSTMLRDRNTKFLIYQQQKVPYYLLIDLGKKVIEIYKLVEEHYKLQSYLNGYEFLLGEQCKIAPTLDNIWE
jgi:Uma2 family endonuclease